MAKGNIENWCLALSFHAANEKLLTIYTHYYYHQVLTFTSIINIQKRVGIVRANRQDISTSNQPIMPPNWV